MQVLNLIQELLPHVAALNLLSTNMHQATGPLEGVGGHQDFQGCFQSSSSSSTTSHHYAWVESDHPYKPASVSNYRCVWLVLTSRMFCWLNECYSFANKMVSLREREREHMCFWGMLYKQRILKSNYKPILSSTTFISTLWVV